MTLLEKARAGRKAALASLNEKADTDTEMTSIFDFDFEPPAKPIPSFTSVRSEGSLVRLAA
ncbi:MAG: hypothetical protein ACU0CY_13690 [Maritimibacter harenae]|jgi:hypothetical protein|uniref:Uncharacterized protein n=1 Tax=Maritimibacter harenae TaxID=2606218 RepID=A0A845LZK9_9RHOB|nr:hypothetical protein [Maritimibacter harenae]MZR12292.1 hypothetical protein [Maritimibacter harenae]